MSNLAVAQISIPDGIDFVTEFAQGFRRAESVVVETGLDVVRRSENPVDADALRVRIQRRAALVHQVVDQVIAVGVPDPERVSDLVSNRSGQLLQPFT